MFASILTTDKADRWLSQFEDSSDRQVGQLLLRSLRFVSHHELTTGITGLVQALASDSDRPSALFSIREIEAGRPYFDPHNQSQPPRAVDPEKNKKGGFSGVGSEGIIANLTRDLSRGSGGRMMDHPSVEAMRDSRCAKLILVDDIVGSGDRAQSFVDALWLHPSIRSWTSGRQTEVFVVALAATELGIRKLRRRKRPCRVRYSLPTGGGAPNWTMAERDSVYELCSRYAKRTRTPKRPFGYRGIFSSVVFEHGCPNTAPAILTTHGTSWRPLFPNRPGTGHKDWLMLADPTGQARSLVAGLTGSGLAGQDLQQLSGWRGILRLGLLLGMKRRMRRADRLGALLGVDIGEVEEQIALMVEFGWCSASRRLTDRGRDLVGAAQRVGVPTVSRPQLKGDFYYPGYRGKVEARESSSEDH